MDGEKIISGTIGEVKLIKEGQTNKDGKIIPWSLFSVTIEGNQFRTFDRRFQTLVGQKGKWKYKEEQRTGADGSTYISKTLLSLPKPTGLTAEQGEKIMKSLEEVNKKLDELLTVAVIYPKDLGKSPETGNKVVDEEIPDDYEIS